MTEKHENQNAIPTLVHSSPSTSIQFSPQHELNCEKSPSGQSKSAFNCEICLFYTENQTKLNLHLAIKHEQCWICGEKYHFSSKIANSGVFYHLKSTHNFGFHKCGTCEFAAHSEESLLEHQICHKTKGSSNRYNQIDRQRDTFGFFNCQKCEFATLSEDSLIEHQINHSMQGNRIFEKHLTCNICDVSFENKEQLEVHQTEKQHNRSDTTPNSSDKSTIWVYPPKQKDESQHDIPTKSHSSNTTSAQFSPQHECEICSFSTVIELELHFHLATVHDFCWICKNSWPFHSKVENSGISCHLKNVHDYQIFYCKQCPYVTLTENCLIQHESTHEIILDSPGFSTDFPGDTCPDALGGNEMVDIENLSNQDGEEISFTKSDENSNKVDKIDDLLDGFEMTENLLDVDSVDESSNKVDKSHDLLAGVSVGGEKMEEESSRDESIVQEANLSRIRNLINQNEIKLWLDPYYDNDNKAPFETEMLQTANALAPELEMDDMEVYNGMKQLQEIALDKSMAREIFNRSGQLELKLKLDKQAKEQNPDLGAFTTINIDAYDTGDDLFNEVSKTINLPIGMFKLVSAGSVIKSDVRLNQQNLKPGQTVMVLTVDLSSVDLANENSNKVDKTNDLLGSSEITENSIDKTDDNSPIKAEEKCKSQEKVVKAYECYFCEAVFMVKFSVKNHVLKNHPTEIYDHKKVVCQKFRCSHCQKSFEIYSLLETHFADIHKEQLLNPEKIYIGDTECTAANLFSRKPTKSTKDEKVKKSVQCDNCHETFFDQQTLKRHIKSKHQPKKPVFLCTRPSVKDKKSLCKATFPRSDSLAKHIRLVHEKNKPFSCPNCAKPFPDDFSLQRHKFSCAGSKHKCPHCDKEYTQKGNLKEHIRKEHNLQPENDEN